MHLKQKYRINFNTEPNHYKDEANHISLNNQF